MKKKLNSAFLFFSGEKGLVAVDTKNQKYYLINDSCLDRIFSWIDNKNFTEFDESLDSELVKSGLLVDDHHETDYSKWLGDPLSWFFYNSIKNKNIIYSSKEEFISRYLNTSKKTILPNDEIKSSFEHQTINLPTPNLDTLKKTSLFDSLKERKTSRSFYKDPIDLDILNTILFVSFGYIHGKEWDEFQSKNFQQLGFRKTSPSASGIHCCSAFVYVQNVNGLKKGIYRYNPEDHNLFLIKEDISDHELSYYVCDQFWVEGIAAGIFIILDMHLVWAKDKNVRALPVAYLEAGHFSQTIQLCATSLGMKTWLTGTFRDDVVSRDFGIDLSRASPVAFVGFGNGENTSIPQEFSTVSSKP